MIAAVITLGLALLAAIGGMVYLVKTNRDDREAGETAADLYRQQQMLTDDVRRERDEIVGKLAATDAQLKESTIRLKETERQRDEAQAIAREKIRQEIRSAPNAVDALSKVLAVTHPGGVHRNAEAEAKAGGPGSGSGVGRDDSLLTP